MPRMKVGSYNIIDLPSGIYHCQNHDDSMHALVLRLEAFRTHEKQGAVVVAIHDLAVNRWTRMNQLFTEQQLKDDDFGWYYVHPVTSIDYQHAPPNPVPIKESVKL